jgi:competence protein ComEA
MAPLDVERAVPRGKRRRLMSHLPVLAALVVAVALAPPTTAAAPAARAETVKASATVGGGKVNINTASVKELMTLTGVGRGLAEKIVKHRDEHGLFKKPEDLRKVDGVGGDLWEKNRARIVVK